MPDVENTEVDVIVVGGGGTGLAAAVGAREAGASVVMLEKNPALGGTTARSIGSITATQTPHQARHGIDDTPVAHFEDMELFSKAHADRPDNPILGKLLTENVPETMRWLDAMGVEFFGPLEEPPHRKRRMHNVLPNSPAYIYHLARRARRIGVDIRMQARVERLLVEKGRVTGIEYDAPGQGGAVLRARGGVILGAGDYAASPEFKRKYISPLLAETNPTNPTATGDGHRMALALGARIINGDMYGAGLRFIAPARPSWISKLPPQRWFMRPANRILEYLPGPLIRKLIMGFMVTVMVPQSDLLREGGVMINRRGERFVDELKRMILEVTAQPDGLAYIVFDEDVASKFNAWPFCVSTAPGIAYAYLDDYARNRPDLYHRADTLEALAQIIGAPTRSLADTIQRYNDNAVETGTVPSRGARPRIARGPFYALGPVINLVNYTDGGLAVNTRLQVLGPDDVPIPGLYAAGSTGQGGLLLKGHGHHLGWAFTSGRLAGRDAAQAARLAAS